MRNVLLILEYDGTDFVGWQRQPNGRTVQEELEKVLSVITQSAVSITGAGRTDSGVHASGQAANFKTESALTMNDFRRALNGLLPDDISVLSVEEVPMDFSARFSATSREYRYVISRVPTALQRRYCWELGYDLDLAAMNRIAASIIGTHDFQSMCKTESATEHFLCRVECSEWRAMDETLIYSVRANRFLQGMVRALVGTMVDIGRGFTPESEFSSIMASKQRSRAGQAAPAKGLFLKRVTY